jgi:hypothetical protein
MYSFADSEGIINSTNIIRFTKSRRMKMLGRVTLWGRGDVHTGFWWRNLKERDYLEDLDVDDRIL